MSLGPAGSHLLGLDEMGRLLESLLPPSSLTEGSAGGGTGPEFELGRMSAWGLRHVTARIIGPTKGAQA